MGIGARVAKWALCRRKRSQFDPPRCSDRQRRPSYDGKMYLEAISQNKPSLYGAFKTDVLSNLCASWDPFHNLSHNEENPLHARGGFRGEDLHQNMSKEDIWYVASPDLCFNEWTPLDVVFVRCTAASACAKIKEPCVQTRKGGAHRPDSGVDSVLLTCSTTGLLCRFRRKKNLSGYLLSINRLWIIPKQKW